MARAQQSKRDAEAMGEPNAVGKSMDRDSPRDPAVNAAAGNGDAVLPGTAGSPGAGAGSSIWLCAATADLCAAAPVLCPAFEVLLGSERATW